MSVEIADVADALVAFLEAQTFTAPYAKVRPERLYDPEYKPDQLSSLKVSVVGLEWSQEPASRDSHDNEVTLGVCLQKYTDRSLRDMDGLVKLAREVAKACLEADLPAVGALATKAEFSMGDPYSVQKYREESTFWCGIIVTLQLQEVA